MGEAWPAHWLVDAFARFRPLHVHAERHSRATGHLKSGRCPAHNGAEPVQKPNMTGRTAEEQAEWYVSGKTPDRRSQKRRKGGAA
jgi:hypothetical protein